MHFICAAKQKHFFGNGRSVLFQQKENARFISDVAKENRRTDFQRTKGLSIFQDIQTYFFLSYDKYS